MDEQNERAPQHDLQTAADRRLANIVIVVLLTIIIGGGVWLANALYEQRQLDDCLAQGRRNCAPVDAPSR